MQFCGTRGVLAVSRGGYELVPDVKVAPESQIPPWSNPPEHPQAQPFAPEPRTAARKGAGDSPEPMDHHARHFLDCIKTRQRPIADVEDGHRVATACHLANLSLLLGRKLEWNADKEEVVNDPGANAMLVRPYRKPWDEILRSLNL